MMFYTKSISITTPTPGCVLNLDFKFYKLISVCLLRHIELISNKIKILALTLQMSQVLLCRIYQVFAGKVNLKRESGDNPKHVSSPTLPKPKVKNLVNQCRRLLLIILNLNFKVSIIKFPSSRP